MPFSSVSFLYFFLPVTAALYFSASRKMKNLILLIASMFFYFYGEPVYSLLMAFSSLTGYLYGLWIQKAKSKKEARFALICSVVFSIGLLVFFKYSDFFIENINSLTGADIPLLYIPLPIGISFYTFQILSYTIDVYRGQVEAERNIIDFSAYVSLFPQLIAGPIVRYCDIRNDLRSRSHSVSGAASGAGRFVIGLTKKVLIANTLAELVSSLANAAESTVLLYWISAAAFSLQIYYDFSGYSDMAIGLGRIFGFHFPENFNYPFVSKSVTEFWRRWHISLGTWFRDYVYIPMGGSRIGKANRIRNILVVWFLTGFWHGAQWNFVIWGLYFAFLLITEKLFLKRVLDRLPRFFRHLYLILAVTISFVIFNSNGTAMMRTTLKGMFGALGLPFSGVETVYYLESYAVVLLIAAVGATPAAAIAAKRLKKSRPGEKAAVFLEPALYACMLLLATGYLVDGSFNPFLYFRF
ncbi:MAG: Peptidoglycan O-acetyltransferase [Firmicutes bacterium ADurb.Bin182]|nr:MAG: Peptidoglycan O-acetyltransferase [Firmicutes bacterium ADurb.Bin182]